jgi:thioredoxin reductase (NADPH)
MLASYAPPPVRGLAEGKDMAEIKVYGAPWCPDCRRSKKFLAEHRVPYDWVDIDQDHKGLAYVQELQQGGRTIPTIVFPDGSYLLEPTDEALATKLGLSLAAERNAYDLVIAGGGPAGLTAAIYAAREGIQAVVVDSGGLGGQAGITERVDNYPGFPEGIRGADLADRLIAHARRYGVELLPAVSVATIEADCPGDQSNGDLRVTLGTGQELCTHAVLVATGTSYRRLGIPGEEDLIGAGVHFCATCDGPFYAGAEEILVVGGGNSGLEEGIFLSQFASRVRIVEFAPELRASPLLQDKVRQDPHFVVHTNTEVTEMRGKGKVEEVIAKDRESGKELRWTPAGVFVFIGLDPNTEFLRGTLELDRWGFVVTDEGFQTSLPGVYAAGDVRAGSTKQLGAAVGEGVTGLLMVRSHLQRHAHLPVVEVNA